MPQGGGERRGSRQGSDSSGGADPVARRRYSSLLGHAGVSEKFVSTLFGTATSLGGPTGGCGQIFRQCQGRMAGMEEERPPAREIVL